MFTIKFTIYDKFIINTRLQQSMKLVFEIQTIHKTWFFSCLWNSLTHRKEKVKKKTNKMNISNKLKVRLHKPDYLFYPNKQIQVLRLEKCTSSSWFWLPYAKRSSSIKSMSVWTLEEYIVCVSHAYIWWFFRRIEGTTNKLIYLH